VEIEKIVVNFAMKVFTKIEKNLMKEEDLQ